MMSRQPSRTLLLVLALAFVSCAPAPRKLPVLRPELPAPLSQPLPEGEDESLRFAVIGDSGTGDSYQHQVGETMASYQEIFPFELVLMLGDNLYGSEDPEDFVEKFEEPYRALLEAGVEFYASLGNHDEAVQTSYEPFHMGGKTYYTFKPRGFDVRFFALYTDVLDRAQLQWLQEELEKSEAAWKIAFFHHPIYSSARRHGSNLELRRVLEPLFVRYGVDVVFSGHDHVYERTEPQHGITYFVSGAAARLRRGNVVESELTAAHFDEDRSFLLVEIAGQELRFVAISRTGEVVDRGTISEVTSTDDSAAQCEPVPLVVGTLPTRHPSLERCSRVAASSPPSRIENAVR